MMPGKKKMPMFEKNMKHMRGFATGGPVEETPMEQALPNEEVPETAPEQTTVAPEEKPEPSGAEEVPEESSTFIVYKETPGIDMELVDRAIQLEKAIGTAEKKEELAALGSETKVLIRDIKKAKAVAIDPALIKAYSEMFGDATDLATSFDMMAPITEMSPESMV